MNSYEGLSATMQRAKVMMVGISLLTASCVGGPNSGFVADPGACGALGLERLDPQTQDLCATSQQTGSIPHSAGQLIMVDRTGMDGQEVLLIQAKSAIADVEGDTVARFSLSGTLGLVFFEPAEFSSDVQWNVTLESGDRLSCSHETTVNDIFCD